MTARNQPVLRCIAARVSGQENGAFRWDNMRMHTAAPTQAVPTQHRRTEAVYFPASLPMFLIMPFVDRIKSMKVDIWQEIALNSSYSWYGISALGIKLSFLELAILWQFAG